MARHKHYDVIIAWANGKEIQRQDEQGWFDWDNSLGLMPHFDFGNWRIKPKTIKKEGWVNIAPSRTDFDDELAGYLSHAYRTKEEADASKGLRSVATIRIEWEEEEQ
jgi:hypothetical protein